MGRLRKLLSTEISRLESPRDRFYILKDIDPSSLEEIKEETRKIIQILRGEFPSLSSRKSITRDNGIS